MTPECIPHWSFQTEAEDKTRLELKTTDEDGKIIGQAVVYIYFGSLAVIERLSVLPENRRHSIGTQLLGEIERWAAEHGARRSFVRFEPCDLLPSDWLASSRFFLKHDYTLVGLGFTKQLSTATDMQSS